ncbi:MAG: 6-phosphogluconolactonase, partial [Candidatus Omnitrophica bacterium]|nr:6-phosphogluconolactonase [Candidatus Omnitrophota bacterium]
SLTRTEVAIGESETGVVLVALAILLVIGGMVNRYGDSDSSLTGTEVAIGESPARHAGDASVPGRAETGVKVTVSRTFGKDGASSLTETEVAIGESETEAVRAALAIIRDIQGTTTYGDSARLEGTETEVTIGESGAEVKGAVSRTYGEGNTGSLTRTEVAIGESETGVVLVALAILMIIGGIVNRYGDSDNSLTGTKVAIGESPARHAGDASVPGRAETGVQSLASVKRIAAVAAAVLILTPAQAIAQSGDAVVTAAAVDPTVLIILGAAVLLAVIIVNLVKMAIARKTTGATVATPAAVEGPESLNVYEAQHFAGQAAQDVAAKIKALLETKDSINIIFATGNTMKFFLRELAKIEGIEWARIKAFHLDEYRGLRADHEASFATFLTDNLFSRVNIPQENIHLVADYIKYDPYQYSWIPQVLKQYI